MIRRIAGFVCVFILMTVGLIGAEIPQMISYQGKVTDSGGVPVPDGDYARVVEEIGAGGLPGEGEIVDREGTVLGRHTGVHHFTVGQRRRLGVSGTRRLYVSEVDAERVASLGFCFGGTQSMYMGTRNPELAAVVIFYGSGPIQDAAQLGSMGEAGPVLGIYGEKDRGIPVEQVRNFESALNSRDVENTITVYPGVGHAFVKGDTYQSGGAPQQAWDQMVGFLRNTLSE